MSDERDLDALRFHWGDAYTIWHFPGQPWQALRKNGPAGEPLTAATADELRGMIRADYGTPTDQGSL